MPRTPETRRKPTRPARGRPAATADALEERHDDSPTAIAAEAYRTGVLPRGPRAEAERIPGEDDKMRAGDPDTEPLLNEYSGEDIPGGDTPTPDESVVDDIGRAYGLEEPESGPLLGAAEILERRDRKRRRG